MRGLFKRQIFRTLTIGQRNLRILKDATEKVHAHGLQSNRVAWLSLVSFCICFQHCSPIIEELDVPVQSHRLAQPLG